MNGNGGTHYQLSTFRQPLSLDVLHPPPQCITCVCVNTKREMSMYE